jgi:hypothetical protein
LKVDDLKGEITNRNCYFRRYKTYTLTGGLIVIWNFVVILLEQLNRSTADTEKAKTIFIAVERGAKYS